MWSVEENTDHGVLLIFETPAKAEKRFFHVKYIFCKIVLLKGNLTESISLPVFYI